MYRVIVKIKLGIVRKGCRVHHTEVLASVGFGFCFQPSVSRPGSLNQCADFFSLGLSCERHPDAL